MTTRLPVPVSFEFFPPNTPVGSEKLKTVTSELATVGPEFFSVTYGAGGSTRDKTLATVSDIAALGQEAAPHLSCVGSTQEGISEMPSLVEPTHDRCGAASWPSAAMSLTVASVLSRVEPPAP